MTAQRMPNNSYGSRIHKGKRYQQIYPSAMIHNSLHGGTDITHFIRVGIIFSCMQKWIIHHQTNIAPRGKFMRIGLAGSLGNTRRSVFTRLGTAWQTNHPGFAA